MDFPTKNRRLFLSSVDFHILINPFLCLLILFGMSFYFDDSRLLQFVSYLLQLLNIPFQTRVISQKYSIFESNNLISRIVFICLVIGLMVFTVVFTVVFPLLLIISSYINYIILALLYLAICLVIVVIIIITASLDEDLKLFRLVNSLSRFAVKKTSKIVLFINSILGAKYFPVRSLFVLLINASMLVNAIACLFVLLILSVIWSYGNNLTLSNIILYLLIFSVIVSLIRIFINTKFSLKANKLYRQGNELFKQETETSKIEAIEIFEQALRLYQKTNYQIWAAITLNNIGLVYNTLEQKQTALDYFNQSLDLFKKMKSISGEAMTMNNIGLVYDALEEKQIALDYFNQSLDLSRTIQDRETIAKTFYNLAVLKYNQGNLNEALTKIESAIKIIEELYTEIIITNLSKSYFATVQNYYQFYMDLLIKLHEQNPNQGYNIKAYEVSEKLKNR